MDDSITVTEGEIRDGFRFLYARAKLAAEPAAAAGVGALLAGKVAGRGGENGRRGRLRRQCLGRDGRWYPGFR